MGYLATTNTSTAQLLPLWLRKHHRRRGGKILRVRTLGSLLLSSLSRNDCIIRTRPKAISMDKLTQKGDIFIGSYP